MIITTLTERLINGQGLDDLDAEVEGAAGEMMSGEATPVQMAALLTALRVRGETPRVTAAFARALRKRATPFKTPAGPLLDTCGTGGDHSGTFNISTAAAFVAAGAGVRVAKHGNRSMTSRCGSADVLAELGVRVDCEPAIMEQALQEIGICFLFAQSYHQSMKHVGPVRQQLGFRTVFNIIGPLSNPAKASHQLLGVGAKPLARLLAEVLAILGSQNALVVHGSDGLDEITTTGPTFAYYVQEGRVREAEITPQEANFALSKPEDLKGGDIADNARIMRDILMGKSGPKLDIVLLNAGAAIMVAGVASDIKAGVAQARQSIESGAALDKLERLAALTNGAAIGTGS